MLPFLKWAGGKRWFVEGFSHLLPEKYNLYYEPFLGSGAVFFSQKPRFGILSDRNEDLINTYRSIKIWPRQVEASLRMHASRHSPDYYYEVRAATFDDYVERAARFIYLNRTCWNGLYRVNLRGQFNVPIGSKTSVILGSDNFLRTSRLLKDIEILSADFENVLDQAKDGDFVFVDPPYTVKHNCNGFVKYNESIFSWEDQERLKVAVDRAVERGALVMVLNANHESVKELYSAYDSKVLQRSSVIAADSKNRGMYDELCVRSWI